MHISTTISAYTSVIYKRAAHVVLRCVIISMNERCLIMTENESIKLVTETVPAFGYVRVSTKEQEDKETQENQKQSIAVYAAAHGLSIVKCFQDLGISGNDNDRPDLNEMLANLDTVKNIIVYDQSRLSRNYEYSLKIMFLFQRLGVRVHLAQEGHVMDYNDDTVQLITSIQSWAAAQERKMINARQKAGIKRYIETHGEWGRKKIKINQKQFDALRTARVSKAAIARVLGTSRATLNRWIKARDPDKTKEK